MKPYPGYKDSGIEWIGKIPSHWDKKKLKYLVKNCIDKSNNNEEFKIALENIESNTGRFIDNNEKEFEVFSGEGKKFKKNDVLFNKLRPYLSKVYLAPRDGSCVGEFLVLKPLESLNSNFLFWRLLSDEFIKEINSSTYGAKMPRASWEFIGNLKIPYPSKNEQKILANYLDFKTKQIDSLILKKSKLIELLKGQRAAMINRAVTKGLNPNAPMKDSGIEWLGKIPEHWEIKKLKWIINDKLKYGANEATETTDKSLPRYIRITDFGEDGRLIDDTFKSLSYEIAKDYLLKDGDILFARSGATVGKTFQYKDYKGIACFAGYLIKATPNPNFILSDFLYIYTKSDAYKNWINSVFIQATIQNIGADKYQSLFIPLPSIDEQRQITDVLKIKINRIEKFISNIDNEIELLKEFRTALISEVVTGKVDVRDEK